MLTAHVQRMRGPDVRINCPACGACDVLAYTGDICKRDMYFGVFTGWESWRTLVQCSQCSANLDSRVRAEQLEGKNPRELADVLYYGSTFLQKAVAVIALLVAVAWGVGPFMCLVAIAVTWKTRAWPRTLSWIAMALSVVAAIVVWLDQVFFQERLVRWILQAP